jgi:uncharacterized membrane protein YheB (UPF0754 family)
MITLLQLAASAALGATIGYATNALAIKSLFRPLRPRWYSLGWQGVVPRNRHKLADSIARVVGEDLLGREYLADQLRGPRFQANLREYVSARADQGLDTTIAELFAQLPASWRQDGLEGLMRRGLIHLGSWVHSEAGRSLRQHLAARAIDHLRVLPVRDVVGKEQAEEMAAALGRSLARPETQKHLTELLQGELGELLQADQPLEELVPAELRELLRERLRQEVPAILNKVAVWLQAPENVDQISDRILDALEAMGDRNRAAGRLLAEIGLQLFGERIRNWVRERLPQVAAEYLNSQETQRRVEAQLLEGIDRFLGRSLRSVTAGHHELLAARIGAVAGTWLTTNEVQQRLTALLIGEYCRHADLRLDEALPQGFWTTLRDRVVELLQVPAGSEAEWGRAAADWLRPQLESSRVSLRSWVGVAPADQEALVAELSARGSEMLQAEVPVLLAQFDIADLVRTKVRGFDLARVERLVRDIISDQLRYINLLGALLGGLVGLALPFLNAWIAALGAVGGG